MYRLGNLHLIRRKNQIVKSQTDNRPKLETVESLKYCHHFSVFILNAISPYLSRTYYCYIVGCQTYRRKTVSEKLYICCELKSCVKLF